MSHLFISYSKKDIEFAKYLRSQLQDKGFAVWMDESRLVPSVQWWPTIEENIISCSAFLVIMSSNSLKSRWVEREILVADDDSHRKPIFPILLEGRHWPRLAEIQYVDMKKGAKAKLSSEFVETLRDLAPAYATVKAPPPLPVELSSYGKPIMMVLLALMLVFASITLGFVLSNSANQAQNGDLATNSALELSHTSETSSVIENDAATETVNAGIIETQNAFLNLTATESANIVLSETQNAYNNATATESANIAMLASQNAIVSSDLSQAALVATENANITLTANQNSLLNATASQNALLILNATESANNSMRQTEAAITATESANISNTATKTNQLSLANSFQGSRNANWLIVAELFPDGHEMVLVPAGVFQMGSLLEEDEQPVHPEVISQGFWLDRYEVSEMQFSGNNSRLPATNISWQAAQDYCLGRGGRLPSEREWEYAAAGVESWIYPWGNDNSNGSSNAVFAENSNFVLANVDDSKFQSQSWVGAYHLAGNAAEWTYSQYSDRYQGQAVNGLGEAMVYRGGSYLDPLLGLRNQARYSENPDRASALIGFRCLIEIPNN